MCFHRYCLENVVLYLRFTFLPLLLVLNLQTMDQVQEAYTK